MSDWKIEVFSSIEEMKTPTEHGPITKEVYERRMKVVEELKTMWTKSKIYCGIEQSGSS